MDTFNKSVDRVMAATVASIYIAVFVWAAATVLLSLPYAAAIELAAR